MEKSFKKLTTIYKCKECFKSFVDLHELEIHKREHMERIYTCTYCSGVANSFDEIREHVKNVHLQFKLCCSECDFSFTSNSEFEEHFFENHKGSNMICKIEVILEYIDLGYENETLNKIMEPDQDQIICEELEDDHQFDEYEIQDQVSLVDFLILKKTISNS